VYITDPDGNGIEVYYEMPKEEWPEEGVLFRGEFPGKLEAEEVAV
jgi:catechol-2,3-dioxygenase